MDRASTSWRRVVLPAFAFVTGIFAARALWRPRTVTIARIPARLPATLAPAAPAARAGLPSRPFGLRLATASAFVALFVAGGALAAWGGNATDQALNDQAALSAGSTTDVVTDVAPTPETPTTDAAGAPQVDAAAPAEAPAVAEPPAVATQSATTPAGPAQVADAATVAVAATPAAPVAPVRVATTSHRVAAARTPRATRHAPVASAEAESAVLGTAPIVWLTPALPDPTPASPVLRRSAARELVAAAGRDWPLALALAGDAGGDVNALTPEALHALGSRVGDIAAGTPPTDRERVLAAYYRAVGLETLVDGLRASRQRLGSRLLSDPRVSIYSGGRDDIQLGRVNERVLAVVAYLAETFGSVEVSSLVSGHRLYARPRVISAHVTGEAVDIAALGGVPIAGNQQAGSVTEQAVRDLMLLPADVEPAQIISLLVLGGPSFALADHADHVHVGF